MKAWKRDLTEGGIRVPMVARWPGHIQPGAQTDYACALYDVFPTLAEITSVSIPTPVDGHSLFPTLTGKQQVPN